MDITNFTHLGAKILILFDMSSISKTLVIVEILWDLKVSLYAVSNSLTTLRKFLLTFGAISGVFHHWLLTMKIWKSVRCQSWDFFGTLNILFLLTKFFLILSLFLFPSFCFIKVLLMQIFVKLHVALAHSFHCWFHCNFWIL